MRRVLSILHRVLLVLAAIAAELYPAEVGLGRGEAHALVGAALTYLVGYRAVLHRRAKKRPPGPKTPPTPPHP